MSILFFYNKKLIVNPVTFPALLDPCSEAVYVCTCMELNLELGSLVLSGGDSSSVKAPVFSGVMDFVYNHCKLSHFVFLFFIKIIFHACLGLNLTVPTSWGHASRAG